MVFSLETHFLVRIDLLSGTFFRSRIIAVLVQINELKSSYATFFQKLVSRLFIASFQDLRSW